MLSINYSENKNYKQNSNKINRLFEFLSNKPPIPKQFVFTRHFKCQTIFATLKQYKHGKPPYNYNDLIKAGMRLSTRQAKDPIPFGFSLYTHKNHCYYVCNHIIKTQDDKRYSCHFCARKDTHPTKESLIHEHINTDMESLFQYVNKQEKKENSTQKEIYIMWAKFIGKHNLSLRTGGSDDIFEIFHKCIEYGKSQESIGVSSAALLPQVSYKYLRKQLILSSADLTVNRLKVFKEEQFVSLSVDGGKNGHIKFLFITVHNVLCTEKPMLLKLIPYFNGKKEDYQREMTIAIEELYHLGITVSSIVGDNLKVQKLALSHNEESSIQNTSDVQIIKSIIYFQCAAHTLSLVLKDCMKDPIFKELADAVMKLSYKLNSKDVMNIIQLNVLQWCSTRWTCLYDVSEFVVKHFQHIVSSLENNHYTITKDMELGFLGSHVFVLLLMYYKKVSVILEDDKTSVCYVLPLLDRGIELTKLNMFENENLLRLYEVLIDKTIDRFHNTKYGELLRLSFALTTQGRVVIRKSYNVDAMDKNNDYEVVFPFNLNETESTAKFAQQTYDVLNTLSVKFEDISNTHDSSFDSEISDEEIEEHEIYKINTPGLSVYSDLNVRRKLYQEFGVPLLDNESQLNSENSEDEFESDDDYESPYSSFDPNIEYDNVEEIEEECSDSSCKRDILTDFVKYIEDSENILKYIANRQELSKDETYNVLNCFYGWIYYDTKSIPGATLLKENKVQLLIRRMKSNKSWKNFALIMASIFCSPATEASCERGFRILGMVNNCERRRQKQDIVNARIRLSDSL